jgi:hypothetical protein
LLKNQMPREAHPLNVSPLPQTAVDNPVENRQRGNLTASKTLAFCGLHRFRSLEGC